jgi:hypothetical protein
LPYIVLNLNSFLFKVSTEGDVWTNPAEFKSFDTDTYRTRTHPVIVKPFRDTELGHKTIDAECRSLSVSFLEYIERSRSVRAEDNVHDFVGCSVSSMYKGTTLKALCTILRSPQTCVRNTWSFVLPVFERPGVVENSNSSDSDFQICPKSDPNPNSSDSDSDFGFGEKSDRTSVSDIRFSCRLFESESKRIRVCVSHWITVKPTMKLQYPSCLHVSKFNCFQQSGDVNSACFTTGVSGELRPLAGRALQRFATSLYFSTLCIR